MTFYDLVSCKLRGRKGCHDFSGISENFNCDVNTEETYQTFEILINYLASSSCLFQTCVFWISQKIECLTIHSMTEIQNLNFILLSFVKILIKSLFQFLHTNTTPNTLLYFKRYSVCLLKFSWSSVLHKVSRISPQIPPAQFNVEK